MPPSASPVPRSFLSPTPILLTALAVGTALSPTSTKIAGITWLAWCLWGLALRLAPRAGRPLLPHPALPAVHAWAAGCGAAMGFCMLKAGYWSDPLDEVYGQLRLLLAAAAAWWVLTRAVLPGGLRPAIGDALAAQGGFALAWVVWVFTQYDDPRRFLPSNAIPWAHAVAFGLCLSMPLALHADGQPRWRRRLWWAGLALGCAAVLTSQSRGAFGVFAWMLWLLVARWRQVHGHWPVRRLAMLAAGACVAAAAVWCAPGDPLRVRMAEHEIALAERGTAYDTSLGTRLYLWNMALQGLRESPWVGVGEAERMRRIHRAGDELPAQRREGLAVIRTMGHVHNQYLHSALDGGIVGLAGLLAVMAGLAVAAWRLRRVDRLAAWQMQGLLFVHGVGGLTNVNFVHNYYVVTLSMAAAIVLLGVRRSPAPAA